MSELAILFAVSNHTGLLKILWSLLKQLVVLCFVICITDADLPDNPLEAQLSPATLPLASHAMPDLPLPANLPLFHKPRRKRLSHRNAPKFVLAAAQPPNHGPLITSAHPPSIPRLSKPSMSELVPPVAGLAPPRLADIAPTQSGAGTMPTGLAQPPLSPHTSNKVLKRGSQDCDCVYPIKLDILLLNVSSNPNWNLFLEQFASQLGLGVSQIELINFYLLSLARLNISMDITPNTGNSFSASEASGINSSLSMHRVRLDNKLVGGYELLNLTWFKPVAPSQGNFRSHVCASGSFAQPCMLE